MDFQTLDRVKVLSRFDKVCARGLSSGLGKQDGQMCIEAAICYALELPHGDDPQCVTASVRAFKINLNDSPCWVSSASRAQHLRALGIAQIGSKGVVDSLEFSTRMTKKTIQQLIPKLFRELYPGKFTALVDRCEQEGTREAARAVSIAAYAAADAAADAATYAAAAADAAAATAADAAAYAAYAAANAVAAYAAGEKYLILAATLALETLRELQSPGCAWLEDAVV